MNPQNGLRFLSINGVEPTPENIANGSYPFTVNVYAITTPKGLENPNTQTVIDWLVSSQGQQLIEQVGYTPLN
jgi:phosphate transport system substrate-binding protein